MKLAVDILLSLNKKIDEHKKEIELVNEQFAELKKEVSPQTAMKHMVLKDKIMFHKACLLCLEDLKKEIE